MTQAAALAPEPTKEPGGPMGQSTIATLAGTTEWGASSAPFDDPSGRENMQQLIQLRWIAVIGQVVTIAVVHYGLHISLPLHDMFVVLLCLVAFNAASLLRLRLPVPCRQTLTCRSQPFRSAASPSLPSTIAIWSMQSPGIPLRSWLPEACGW